MEDILKIYRKVVKGVTNMELYNYNSLNLHFSGGMLNVYDYLGQMPNRYPLPSDEEAFIKLLNKIDKEYEKILDNNQYICAKCKKTFDLPAAKKNKMGFLACEKCADGGDIREARQTEQQTESEIPSTVPLKNIKDAIKYLQREGYVVKKLIPRYKVVYRDVEGQELVSANHFSNKEEFKKAYPGFKFIGFVKNLSDSEEIDV